MIGTIYTLTETELRIILQEAIWEGIMDFCREYPEDARTLATEPDKYHQASVEVGIKAGFNEARHYPYTHRIVPRDERGDTVTWNKNRQEITSSEDEI